MEQNHNEKIYTQQVIIQPDPVKEEQKNDVLLPHQVRIYAFYDKVAEQSGLPFESINHGIASRNFRKAIVEVKGKTREDFQLWYLGVYDKKTMLTHNLDEPELIEEGME